MLKYTLSGINLFHQMSKMGKFALCGVQFLSVFALCKVQNAKKVASNYIAYALFFSYN